MPGVNASMLVGPYFKALIGSMSPSKSSAVKSGLPCILINLSTPLTFLVFSAFLTLHNGHAGFAGSQLYGQSFAFSSGSIFAIVFAIVVLPTPGGPIISTCLPINNALFN